MGAAHEQSTTELSEHMSPQSHEVGGIRAAITDTDVGGRGKQPQARRFYLGVRRGRRRARAGFGAVAHVDAFTVRTATPTDSLAGDAPDNIVNRVADAGVQIEELSAARTTHLEDVVAGIAAALASAPGGRSS